MEPESGCKRFSIWLVGDSPPKNWENKLAAPLDPRHPARHNIWTPVVEGIQAQVFCDDRRRLDTTRLYVRNAVENYQDKPPANENQWAKLADSIAQFGRLLKEYNPVLVFTFGAFAFEFINRSINAGAEHAYSNWSTKEPPCPTT